MANKLIIFVAFASLAQSSFALPLTVTYGLSDEQLAFLTQIIVDQDAGLQAKFDAFDPIFDIIEKYASAVIWNVEAGTDDDSGKIAEAIVRVKDALDYALDAIPIALQKSCDTIEVARNETYADVEDAYAVATEALTLAKSGNYSANRPQLEVYQAKVQEDLASVVTSIYNSIRTCIGTEDAATLAEIQRAQDGSGLGLNHVANSVFSAIEVYAVAVTAGTADVSLIEKIEDFRRYAHVGLRGDIENKFSALKTIFIATQTNETAIVTPLAANQYALTVSFYRYQAAADIIFGTITDEWMKVAFGLYGSGTADFSLAEAATAGKLNAAHAVFIDSVKAANPDDTSAVVTATESFAKHESAFPDFFYQALYAAVAVDSSLDESLAVIETLKTAALSGVEAYADLIYETLRNGATWDDETEAEFTEYQEAAPASLQILIKRFFNSIEIVANACHTKTTTDAELSAIQTDAATTKSLIDAFTQGIYAAGLVALEATNAQ